MFKNIVILILIVLVIGLTGFVLVNESKSLKQEPPKIKVEVKNSPAAVDPTPEYMEFASRRIVIKRVDEGQHCEGYLGSQQKEYSKCKEGLRCVKQSGTSEESPGTCMK